MYISQSINDVPLLQPQIIAYILMAAALLLHKRAIPQLCVLVLYVPLIRRLMTRLMRSCISM